MADISPDITVLGAGIVGLCCALALQEKGLRVELVDRDLPGQGASSGNAGVVSPWSIIPQSMPGIWKKVPQWLIDPLGPITIKPTYMPRMMGWGGRFLLEGRRERIKKNSEAMGHLNRECIPLFRGLLRGTGREDLLCDSYYIHAYRHPEMANPDALEYRMRREIGTPVEHIGAAALRHIEPALSHDFKAAILLKGQARVTSPGALGLVLAEKFMRAGGQVRRENVKALQRSDGRGWNVVTETSELRASKLVLSLGAWSTRLLEPLGISIPMQAERGYHVSFPDPGVNLSHSVMDMDRKCVASSMEGGLRIAGTAEFAGLDAPVNDDRAGVLAALAQNMLPGLVSRHVSKWSGQRPSLPDSLPCIGEVEGLPNLIMAFGHSHYGLMMAPETGRIVSEIVTRSEERIDLKPYHPLRFGQCAIWRRG